MRASSPDLLVELAVTNLGVIEHLALVFEGGMTAITGETGAGKTLVLTALDLLIGGRADSSLVGPYGSEAFVEGRFVYQGEELVLQRAVPTEGRSRAYLNGRLSTAASLAEHGGGLVELNGQYSHTALTSVSAQRAALDLFGRVDIGPLVESRLRYRNLERQLEELGGVNREIDRELELLQFQLEEIDQAQLSSVSENDDLKEEETLLAGATRTRDSLQLAADSLGADGPVDAAYNRLLVSLDGNPALEDLVARINDALIEVRELAHEARVLADQSQADPVRLAQVQERRRLLTDLQRKYDGSLEDVITYRDRIAERLNKLQDHELSASSLRAEIEVALVDRTKAEAKISSDRRKAAPVLAERVQAHLRDLALANARLLCEVDGESGDDVQFSVSMNAGMPPQPLAKIASGGELARMMLALRMVLSADPATIIFDEVDSGIGGAAAQAVGLALAQLGVQRQVLVVTHLAQVAAYADQQVSITKKEDRSKASVTANVLDPEGRIVELSRMLSGSPASSSAREHAAELVHSAVRSKAQTRKTSQED